MYYETIFIVNPDVSQDNTEKLVDSLKAKIGKVSGTRIVKQEYWGVRPLAYSIAKRKRGHYVLLVTDGDPSAVAALEQALRLDERVLRFMTTSLTEISDQPSPIIRRKESAAKAAAESDAAKQEAAGRRADRDEQAAEVEDAEKPEPNEPAKPATKSATSKSEKASA